MERELDHFIINTCHICKSIVILIYISPFWTIPAVFSCSIRSCGCLAEEAAHPCSIPRSPLPSTRLHSGGARSLLQSGARDVNAGAVPWLRRKNGEKIARWEAPLFKIQLCMLLMDGSTNVLHIFNRATVRSPSNSKLCLWNVVEEVTTLLFGCVMKENGEKLWLALLLGTNRLYFIRPEECHYAPMRTVNWLYILRFFWLTLKMHVLYELRLQHVVRTAPVPIVE